jgi:hypothetical protein
MRVEHLTMAVKVKDFNDDKLFKIAKLNFAAKLMSGSRSSIHHWQIGLS